MLTITYAPHPSQGPAYVHAVHVRIPERHGAPTTSVVLEDGSVVVDVTGDGALVGLELLNEVEPKRHSQVVAFADERESERERSLVAAAYATALVHWARFQFWLDAMSDPGDDGAAGENRREQDATVAERLQQRYRESRPDMTDWKLSVADDRLALA